MTEPTASSTEADVKFSDGISSRPYATRPQSGTEGRGDLVLPVLLLLYYVIEFGVSLRQRGIELGHPFLEDEVDGS